MHGEHMKNHTIERLEASSHSGKRVQVTCVIVCVRVCVCVCMYVWIVCGMYVVGNELGVKE